MAASALHSSETYEHLSPADIVHASQDVIGPIELDPASTPFANALVRAKKIYTFKDNGLLKRWRAKTVFLNPPGGVYDTATNTPVFRATKKRKACTETGACGLEPGHKHNGGDVVSQAALWWAKLSKSVTKGDVESAIFIGFSLELLATAQRYEVLQPLEFPHCIPEQRLKFDTVAMSTKRRPVRVRGDQPTHSNIIICASTNPDVENKFIKRFSEFGFTRMGEP